MPTPPNKPTSKPSTKPVPSTIKKPGGTTGAPKPPSGGVKPVRKDDNSN